MNSRWYFVMNMKKKKVKKVMEIKIK